MLKLRELKVCSLDVESREISWEIEPSYEDALDYTFHVLRSESPEGPFEHMTPAFEDRYIFVDRRIPTGDQFRKLWYRIRITKKATDEFEDSSAATVQAEPSLDAIAIRRSEMTLFTRAIGRAVWLFKRRTFGTRCRSCWDATMHTRTRELCLDCYDTSFLRGFHNPIEVYMQIDPAAKSQQNNAQMTNQIVVTTARMSFYPEVTPKDVIVEAENKRWRVIKVETSERLRAVIKQELTLHQIDQSDIEYKLPINLTTALRDIQPSPSRMFTNPTDLNAAIADKTPDVFAMYNSFPKVVEE